MAQVVCAMKGVWLSLDGGGLPETYIRFARADVDSSEVPGLPHVGGAGGDVYRIEWGSKWALQREQSRRMMMSP